MSPIEIEKLEVKLLGIKKVEDYRPLQELLESGIVEMIDGREYYINNLIKKIDLDKIKRAKLFVLYDAMFGAGQNTISTLLKVEELHGVVNPYFEGGAPEPVFKNIKGTCDVIRNGKYDIGIVTDGDADRIAIIDEKGDFLDAQKTFALLLKYLHQYKKFTGKVVRGYSSSDLIKKYCDKYNLALDTVRIGFKRRCNDWCRGKWRYRNKRSSA
jgi:phosphomannomutase